MSEIGHFEMIEKIRKRFIEELWPINKAGNPEMGLSAAANAIRTRVDLYGKPITIDLLVRKYQEYVSYMKEINAGRDAKYYSKILTVDEFINRSMYENDFKLPSSKEVDEYLYGH